MLKELNGKNTLQNTKRCEKYMIILPPDAFYDASNSISAGLRP